MRNPIPSLLFLTLLFSATPVTASSDTLPTPQRCIYSIYKAYTILKFSGGSKSSKTDYCKNELKISSISAALSTYCSGTEISAAWQWWSEACGWDDAELEEVQSNATAVDVDALRVVGYKEVSKKKELGEAVLIDGGYYRLYYRSVDNRYGEMDTHHRFGFAMYGFWGGVLLLGILSRLMNVSKEKRLSCATLLSPVRYASHWVGANLIVPRAFGSHGLKMDWATNPTRIEAVVVILYWALSIILCSVSYHSFTGDIFWTDIPTQVWRYVSDRTGVMAISNLPWLWLFAGRNNVFLWATGWKFSTFNLFHRHIARVATLEAIVHAAGYTHQYLKKGTYEEQLAKLYMQFGVVAVVAMGCLLITSVVWIRRKFYESFLLAHILLAVVVVIALFYHVAHEDGEYNPYLWPLVAIWSFDRLLRIIHLIACNVRLKLGSSAMGSEAVATYNKDADVIRLEITPSSALLKPGPGQHYFLYQPASWKGYENHPFTLGAWTTDSTAEWAASTDLQDRHTAKDQTASGITPASDSSSATSTSGQAGSKREKTSVADRRGRMQLVFWIRPYDGWTRRLRDACLGSREEGIVRSTLLIEGPYGERAPLHNFETVLLFAGGTGISSAIPYIQDHVERVSRQGAAGCRTRRLRLFWTSRQPAFLREVATRELQPALELEEFDATLFCTGAGKSMDSSTDASTALGEKSGTWSGAGARLTMRSGRPDMRSLIRSSAFDVTAEGGRIAVLLCGPTAMADEARGAVHAAMKEGCRGIEYVEETFGW
ncbi:hypothetical protein K490DRAFT_51054 [Saccharata proteae CBS 121410]|uniref:FAD-binding FR-type domain-containing protein n=1 Tax=Saccharata proteae CBS 121410 TaxID=1314787 RepID=A0A9P4HLA2_9PEZI|nr:hypothetical protein K490DRAFT_51054 [Saccharata proteae CBS 121410]